MNPAIEAVFTSNVVYDIFMTAIHSQRTANDVNIAAVEVYNNNLTIDDDAAIAAKISRDTSVVATNAATVAANSINKGNNCTVLSSIDAADAIVTAANATVVAANKTIVAIADVVAIANTIAAPPDPFSKAVNAAHIAALNAHSAAINICTATKAGENFSGFATSSIFSTVRAVAASKAATAAATSNVATIGAVITGNATSNPSVVAAAINAAVVASIAANATHAAFVDTVKVIIDVSNTIAASPIVVATGLHILKKYDVTYTR